MFFHKNHKKFVIVQTVLRGKETKRRINTTNSQETSVTSSNVGGGAHINADITSTSVVNICADYLDKNTYRFFKKQTL